jgi:3-dehydroquinate dehydratase-2
MKILIIHGPNLNLLGKRDPKKYGSVTMEEINNQIKLLAGELKVAVEFFQSNHEGEIIDFLQKEESRQADGAVINPAVMIRYAYCFRQALVDWGKLFVEVHMSDINKTGVNKKINILDDLSTRVKQVSGLKEESYYKAFKELVSYLH